MRNIHAAATAPIHSRVFDIRLLQHHLLQHHVQRRLKKNANLQRGAGCCIRDLDCVAVSAMAEPLCVLFLQAFEAQDFAFLQGLGDVKDQRIPFKGHELLSRAPLTQSVAAVQALTHLRWPMARQRGSMRFAPRWRAAFRIW